jgi:uncharacterized protein
MAGKPFIAKTVCDGQHYVYDVNSNHILNVDETVYLAMDYWGVSTLREAERALRPTPAGEVRRAWREIREHAGRGLFSSSRPEGISYGVSPADTRELLKSKMEHLVLNVTERCNQRCGYCVYSSSYKYRRSHSERMMQREVAFKAVDLFLNHSRQSETVRIGFYGGEPLLNFPLIEEVVSYVKSKEPAERLRFNLTTNLTLLTGSMLEFFVANDVSLLVSLDGPEEIHDRYRVFAGGNGTHAVVMRNLRKIRDTAPEYYSKKIRFSAVLAPPSQITKLHDFVQENELLKDAGHAVGDVDDRETTFLNRFTREERTIPDYQQLVERYVQRVTETGEAGDQFLQEVVGRKMLRFYRREIGIQMRSYEHPNGVCMPGLRRLLVSVDGKFHICEKINESLSIGDVEHGLDFDRIDSIIREYAKKSSPSCRECWAIRLCSLCYIHATTDRLDFEKKAERCEGHRNSLLAAMGLYCRILKKNPTALDYMKDYAVS